jgi:hypothetical protein
MLAVFFSGGRRVKNTFFPTGRAMGFFLIHRSGAAWKPNRGMTCGIFTPVYSQEVLLGKH